MKPTNPDVPSVAQDGRARQATTGRRRERMKPRYHERLEAARTIEPAF